VSHNGSTFLRLITITYSPKHDETIQGPSSSKIGVGFNFQENLHEKEVDWFYYLAHFKQVVLSTGRRKKMFLIIASWELQ